MKYQNCFPLRDYSPIVREYNMHYCSTLPKMLFICARARSGASRQVATLSYIDGIENVDRGRLLLYNYPISKYKFSKRKSR